ncbi:transposase, partial [Cereibacter azotoformans]|uniref:transposase n=1 Tax=Cereibacter azotoformans TaxID=43057 RepID=UPI0011B29323
FGETALLHRNLLVHPAEKILLPHPSNLGEDYHANDSGHRRGKRSIWGGRDALRRSLYLAALTASRFDPRFRAFKERLLAAGKARKLVIVACARKLLTVLNAMMRTGTAYRQASD